MGTRDLVSNQVTLIGKIISDFRYSHTVKGEKFYLVEVAIERLSGYVDVLPVMVSEHLLDVKQSYAGQRVWVRGQFRSYDRYESGKRHVILYVYVLELKFTYVIVEKAEKNRICLKGRICKKPIFRVTTTGREITDLLIAVKRTYDRSDYIPCICWAANAKQAEKFSIGEAVQLVGRVQSREYEKKLSECQSVTKIAYEVSVSKIDKLKN